MNKALDPKGLEAATRAHCRSEADCCNLPRKTCSWKCAGKIKNDVENIIAAYLSALPGPAQEDANGR